MIGLKVDMGIEGAARVSEININMNQRKVRKTRRAGSMFVLVCNVCQGSFPRCRHA